MFPETKVQRIPLPEGDRGIAVTISWMRKAVQDGARSPQIRQLALQIVQGVANKDTAGEIAKVYDWVKQHIKFRGEYDETVQAPEVTLKFGAGDCDDHSVLICSLLGAIGYQCRFKTVAVRGEKDFTHVYAEVLDIVSGKWVALDTTVDQASPGWEPPDVSRAKEWKALGNLRMRRTRRFGDAQQTAAGYVDAAMPLVNAFADMQYQNYLRNSYGVGNGQGSAFGVNYYPGGLSAYSSTPSWVWPVVGVSVVLGLFAFSRGGRR